MNKEKFIKELKVGDTVALTEHDYYFYKVVEIVNGNYILQPVDENDDDIDDSRERLTMNDMMVSLDF